MTVKNINEAWAKVNEIFPSDYNEDVAASERAGYKIYRSSINHYDYICDLGDRLEINFTDGSTVNIWVEAEEVEEVKTVKIEDTESEAKENKKVVTVSFDFGSMANVSVTLHEGKTFEECLKMRSEKIDGYINDDGEYIRLEDGKWSKYQMTKFTEEQIDDTLSIVSDAIYDIDDKINGRLADITGIAEARKMLYKSYKEMYSIIKALYPESNLIKKYNLHEA